MIIFRVIFFLYWSKAFPVDYLLIGFRVPLLCRTNEANEGKRERKDELVPWAVQSPASTAIHFPAKLIASCSSLLLCIVRAVCTEWEENNKKKTERSKKKQDAILELLLPFFGVCFCDGEKDGPSRLFSCSVCVRTDRGASCALSNHHSVSYCNVIGRISFFWRGACCLSVCPPSLVVFVVVVKHRPITAIHFPYSVPQL